MGTAAVLLLAGADAPLGLARLAVSAPSERNKKDFNSYFKKCCEAGATFHHYDGAGTVTHCGSDFDGSDSKIVAQSGEFSHWRTAN
jgi:hypothetical protein